MWCSPSAPEWCNGVCSCYDRKLHLQVLVHLSVQQRLQITWISSTWVHIPGPVDPGGALLPRYYWVETLRTHIRLAVLWWVFSDFYHGCVICSGTMPKPWSARKGERELQWGDRFRHCMWIYMSWWMDTQWICSSDMWWHRTLVWDAAYLWR